MMDKFTAIIKDIVYRFRKHSIAGLSSQLAYSIIVALFPFLIFLLILAPYIKVNEDMILQSLKVVVPNNTFQLIKGIVAEILSSKRPHLLFFSFIFFISSLVSGIKAIINGMNKAYNESENRAFYKVWTLCIVGSIALVLIISLCLSMLIFGEELGHYLQVLKGFSDELMVFWDVFRFFLSILILFAIFEAIFYFLPAKRKSWEKVLPGALTSSIGWISTSIGFTYYINNFSDYSKFYGSVGSIFVFMTWILINAVIIFIGVEVNASLEYIKKYKG